MWHSKVSHLPQPPPGPDEKYGPCRDLKGKKAFYPEGDRELLNVFKPESEIIRFACPGALWGIEQR